MPFLILSTTSSFSFEKTKTEKKALSVRERRNRILRELDRILSESKRKLRVSNQKNSKKKRMSDSMKWISLGVMFFKTV